MKIGRREFLAGMAVAGVGGWFTGLRLLHDKEAGVDYIMVAEETPVSFIEGTTTPALTYNAGYPSPVLRVKQGERLRVKLINKLCEPTTIHWHGIRIANAMDGVPYMTQQPVYPEQSFIYDFVCPDAGTFWYHPHTHSIEQLGKGLTGCLIVEEKTPQPFDADVLLQLRDFHLNKDGSFSAFTSHRHAARSGTLGNHQTVNGKVKPVIEIPAGGLVRLRCANLDNTRVYNLSLKDYPAIVLAEDGNPCAPYALDARRTGAGMRLDVGFIAPQAEGEDVVVYDRKGRWHFELCRLRTVASAINRQPTDIPALPPHHIPEPDLANAETLDFVFEWEGALTPTDENGNSYPVFWTINRRAWSEMSHENLPEPLARLQLGKTYLINLYNATPHDHPIHLHGQTFKILKSSKRELTPYFSDTILMDSNERAQIAFVADNPGKWMFHCHVIEHMETGLMGYIEIS